MQAAQLKGFKGDRPYLASLILCDSVAVAPMDGKLTCIGLFDFFKATDFPPPVFAGAMVAIVGVREPVDLRFDAVGYDKNPLGEHVALGLAHVNPPEIGTTATAFVAGGIKLPVERAGIADIVVYGNGERLGSRPIQIIHVTPEGKPL